MKYFLNFLIFVILAACGLFAYLYSSYRNDANLIIKYQPSLTTQIFDVNGDLIANVFNEEHRVYADYDEIPARIIEALLAIEDTSFFEHYGVNAEAISRAMIKNIKAGRFVEGASTITQQLIKNVALTREKKLDRKLKEAVLSFMIENELSKEEILERYLNQVYFGHGYYGIKTAAYGYFKKDLDELNLKEIAILVGIPKAPSSYDPTKNLELSLSRANTVIGRMKAIGWVNEDEYQKMMSFVPTIYNETLTKNKSPYVVDEVIREASVDFPDIKTGGYKIYTSIDLKVQEAAEKALKFGYSEILRRDSKADPDNLNGAMIVSNPKSGEVLALVGGIDYTKSNFNRATQSRRQPGSSFKPFIYQVALDSGMNPMTLVEDIPKTYDTGGKGKDQFWTPQNFGKNYAGIITMKRALQNSRNLATINIIDRIGIQETTQALRNYGFYNIPAYLSIALGTFSVPMLEYSSIYSMFAGQGTITEQKLILYIEKDEKKVKDYIRKRRLVLKPEQAYLMVTMMKNVVDNGTGRNAKVPGIEIAGKTGTTNNSIDAWFVAYTPEVQALIWYGNDNHTPMKKTEGGARTAAPVFKKFIEDYLKLYPDTKRTFTVPPGVYTRYYQGQEEYFTATSPLPTKSQTAAGTAATAPTPARPKSPQKKLPVGVLPWEV